VPDCPALIREHGGGDLEEELAAVPAGGALSALAERYLVPGQCNFGGSRVTPGDLDGPVPTGACGDSLASASLAERRERSKIPRGTHVAV
jgi:hypothetical protein